MNKMTILNQKDKTRPVIDDIDQKLADFFDDCNGPTRCIDEKENKPCGVIYRDQIIIGG